MCGKKWERPGTGRLPNFCLDCKKGAGKRRPHVEKYNKARDYDFAIQNTRYRLAIELATLYLEKGNAKLALQVLYEVEAPARSMFDLDSNKIEVPYVDVLDLPE